MNAEIEKHLPVIIAVGLIGGGFLLFRSSNSGPSVVSNPIQPDNSVAIAANDAATQLEVLKIQAASAAVATTGANALAIQQERDTTAVALTQIQAGSNIATAKALESTSKNKNTSAVVSTGLTGLFNFLGTYYKP